MSTVTNIILHTDMENDGVQLIQNLLSNVNKGQLQAAPINSGGGKCMEIDLYTGAYNAFGDDTVEKLVGLFHGIAWEEPHRTVLIITPQDGETKVYRPKYSSY